MRHKTLSRHPRNYELYSLTLLKGVHLPIFLPYLMGAVSVLKTDIKMPFTAKIQSKVPQKHKVKRRKNIK